jgi:hypothetical protein
VGLHNRVDRFEVRPSVARVGTRGTGTLACPGCDAPVSLGGGAKRPHDTLSCPFCGCAGALREFLSLAAPTRPARVEIRLVLNPA